MTQQRSVIEDRLIKAANKKTTKELREAYISNKKLVNDCLFRNEVIEFVLRRRGKWS